MRRCRPRGWTGWPRSKPWPARSASAKARSIDGCKRKRRRGAGGGGRRGDKSKERRAVRKRFLYYRCTVYRPYHSTPFRPPAPAFILLFVVHLILNFTKQPADRVYVL